MWEICCCLYVSFKSKSVKCFKLGQESMSLFRGYLRSGKALPNDTTCICMAGRSWSFSTSAILVRISFNRSSFDPCEDRALTSVQSPQFREDFIFTHHCGDFYTGFSLDHYVITLLGQFSEAPSYSYLCRVMKRYLFCL